MTYEAVHARPDGTSTVARMALVASEYGYDGIVVRNHGDAAGELDPSPVRDAYDVDVVPGVEVRTDDPARASGFVGSHRADRTVVAVHGGTRAMNRFAVGQAAVDVLAHPTRDGANFDHVLAREAADNDVRVEVSLGPLVRETGGARVRRLQDLRRLRDLIDAYDVPYVVSLDARSHLDLRAPRELEALGGAVGVSEEWIAAGLAEWRVIAERNRARESEAFVEPGVWVVDGEDE